MNYYEIRLKNGYEEGKNEVRSVPRRVQSEFRSKGRITLPFFFLFLAT